MELLMMKPDAISGFLINHLWQSTIFGILALAAILNFTPRACTCSLCIMDCYLIEIPDSFRSSGFPRFMARLESFFIFYDDCLGLG